MGLAARSNTGDKVLDCPNGNEKARKVLAFAHAYLPAK
jgi:hypothetical protein